MNRNIVQSIILGILLLLAVLLGTTIGNQNYLGLSGYVSIGIILWFLTVGWKITWKIAAFFVLSGLIIQQSFAFGGNHLMFLMILLGSIISLVNRNRAPVPKLIKDAGVKQLKFFVGILLVYGAGHFFINYVYPVDPSEYSLGNASKAYFTTFASFVLLWWLVASPYQFRINDQWSKAFMLILSFAVLLNVISLSMMTLRGYGNVDGPAANDPNAIDMLMYIPIINAYLNRVELRQLAPVATFLLSLYLLNPDWRRRQSILIKALAVIAMGAALVGALISGGRITLIMSVFLIMVALVKNRKMGAIFGSVIAFVFLVVIVNVFTSWINTKAPFFISRSVQFMMIEKGDAYLSIQDSNDSRNLAAEIGWKEWRGDNRIFLIGRTVYRHLGTQEYFAIRGQIGDKEAFALYAFRSGGVHNLYGDLALQYGIVGMLLYTLAMISIMVYFRRLYRLCLARNLPSEVSELAFFCAVTIPLFYIYQILGGTFFSVLYPLMLGLIRARISHFESIQDAQMAEEKEALQKAEDLRSIGGMSAGRA
ncbi:hypothetical protein OAF33_00735 [bacterium]|nr:hypothetical protein [bacterium]MDB4754139.1 hypothetical protein [Akkermansiaceae bacterium]